MDTPTRRAVLAGTAGTAALFAAGCLDDAGANGPRTGSDGEDDSSDGTDDEGDSDESRGDGPITEDPRVDTPPHEIGSPEPPENDDGEWNDHYLGEQMATEPTLAFESVHGVRLEEPALASHVAVESPDDEAEGTESSSDGDEPTAADGSLTDPAEEPPTNSPSEADPESEIDPESAPVDGEFAVHLLTADGDLEDVVVDHVGEGDRATLEAVDFDEQVVVLVESGWGSSSIRHQWVRVEDSDDDAIDLHGYYTAPQVQTHDYTTRHSAVVVERPDADVSFARIRLTVDEDHRVNVNSTEGAVALERE